MIISQMDNLPGNHRRKKKKSRSAHHGESNVSASNKKSGKRKFKTNYNTESSSDSESDNGKKQKTVSSSSSSDDNETDSSDDSDDFVTSNRRGMRVLPLTSSSSSSDSEPIPNWKRKLTKRRMKRKEIAKLRKTLTLRQKRTLARKRLLKTRQTRRLFRKQKKMFQQRIKQQINDEIQEYLNSLDTKHQLIDRGRIDYPRWMITQFNFGLNFIESELAKLDSFSAILNMVNDLFIRAIENAIERVGPISDNDRVRIIVRNPQLDRITSTKFMRISELDIENDLLSKFEQVIQSNENAVFADTLEINIVVARAPRQHGGGYLRRTMMSLERYLQKKQSIVMINNKKDNMCFARALVITKSFIEYKNGTLEYSVYNSISKGRLIQGEWAKTLHELAKVDSDKECGFNEWRQFQNYMSATYPDQYSINVWSMEAPANKCIYSGNIKAKHQLHILHYNDHYAAINSITGFLCRSYYCPKCKVGVCEQSRHKCFNICKDCHKPNCQPQDVDVIECKKCNREFQSRSCYNNHLTKTKKKNQRKLGPSTCETFKRCKYCCKTFKPSDYRESLALTDEKYLSEHACNDMYCVNCRAYYPDTHQCYVQNIALPESDENLDLVEEGDYDDQMYDFQDDNNDTETDEKEPTSNTKFIFFDFESMFVDGEHIPNLCISQWRCERCLDNSRDGIARDTSYVMIDPLEAERKKIDITHPLDRCRCSLIREKVFSGNQTKEQFCEWLFSDHQKDTICISHNGKAYDNIFCLQYLLKSKSLIPDCIFTGNKIMSIHLEKMNFRIIDSINFLAMPLRDFSKTFNLSEVKGMFPYKFNTPENQNYVGKLPPPSDYGVDKMKPAEKLKFESWYDDQLKKGAVFNMQNEIVKYCRSDVEILRQGCLKFRDIFMEATMSSKVSNDIGFDPFKFAITIASACSQVYRRNFMIPKSIALIPSDGFLTNTRQSKKALQWLYYIEKSRNITLESYATGKEKRILNCYVDGFDSTANKVYQFHGDWHHGNKNVYHPQTINTLRGVTMGTLYQDTIYREKKIIEAGYELESIWEDEFDKLVEDPKVQKILQDYEYFEPLVPKDAYFGGRTGATKLYHKCQGDEKIRYIDFTSLYSAVMYDNDFGIGAMKIITNPEDQDISNYFGIAKVTIQAPEKLYHPVLGYRTNNKLVFALCRSCADHNTRYNDDDDDAIIHNCNHTVKEREFTGTYCTCELMLAVEKNYKIKKIHSVWHFEEKSKDLFKEYISTFLRYKQESDGFPESCQSYADKLEYIKDYEINQGITLRPEKIQKNPGLRKTAKIALNSFYGKWGQRSNLPRRKYINNVGHFWFHLECDDEIVHDCRVISDECLEIHLSKKKEFVVHPKHSNVYIAAWTTALARIKLYRILDQLGTRVLYYDSDSCIYVTNSELERQNKDPKLSNYLGGLTDEIGNGDFITEFISCGAKNYAYKLHNSQETVVKVRGFTLNYSAAQKINFDTMNAMVHGEGPRQIVIEDDSMITRDMNTLTIHNKKITKTYQKVFNKRIVGKDFFTYPHGYKNE